MPAIEAANDVGPSTPAPVIRRSPPPGRPAGALSISELRERIAADVGRMTRDEHERQRELLRAELLQEARTAKSLALLAVVLNVVSIGAIVALARGGLSLLSGVGVAAVEFLVAGGIWAVARRVRPHAFSLIRLP